MVDNVGFQSICQDLKRDFAEWDYANSQSKVATFTINCFVIYLSLYEEY